MDFLSELRKMLAKKGGEAHHTLLISGIVVMLILISIVIFFVLKSQDTSGIGKEDYGSADSIAEQCVFACESVQKIAFCDVERSVDSGIRATCNSLATNTQYSEYGVQPCAAISCSTETQVNDQSCAGLDGVWKNPEGTSCPAEDGKLVRKRTPTDPAPIEGQICCYYYE